MVMRDVKEEEVVNLDLTVSEVIDIYGQRSAARSPTPMSACSPRAALPVPLFTLRMSC